MDGTYSIGNCSVDAMAGFQKSISESTRWQMWLGSMRGKMWKVNALLVVNAILAGVMVSIGAYGHRYRHHPLTRFLFLGATALFLPIVSYVVSTIGNQQSTIDDSFNPELEDIHHRPSITVDCIASLHGILVLVWTALVQIVGISTTAVVVAGDAREGRNVGPPTELLVQAIWTTYLALHFAWTNFTGFQSPLPVVYIVMQWCFLMLPFALIFAKLVFKFYAFYEARLSFSLGRNPRIVVGYMEQLQDGRQHADAAMVNNIVPPPLIVMGEETLQVEEQPHGYRFTRLMSESDQGDATKMNSNGLVTMEKVWQLDGMLKDIPRLKDVCFSFSLFKLLRCRFAGYTVAEAGFMKADNFLRQVLLKDNDHERVLGVITDELSFLHDYYYSSLPISYSKRWLPVFSIFTSLLTISYCLFTSEISVFLMARALQDQVGQVMCAIACRQQLYDSLFYPMLAYGSLHYDLVPVILLLALVVLAEARDIASYICSNWTKVGLICRYVVNHDTWQRSPSMQKWVGRVLRCRCKLTMKQWDNKMNQCSVLVLHPTRTPAVLLMRLLRLPDQKKNVKVPAAVRAAIVDALRSNDGLLSNGAAFLRRSIFVPYLWACRGKGTADIMLIWHIATSILEVKHPHPQPPTSGYKITATHLSRYCAYLVAYVPELLPDDDPWCKSLYKAVKKDAMCVLAGGIGVSTPEAEYQQLVKLLSERSKHEVLKNGAKLGKQLAELVEGEETTWKCLASFWTEMILYVAPSDNLDGHAEAIARGGELVTLLWALLAHVGIVSRPDATAAATG